MKTNLKFAEFRTPGEETAPTGQEDLTTLARLLAKYAPHDDRFELSDEGLHIIRASKTMNEETYVLSEPGICIIAQGAKAVSLAKNSFEYNESNMVVYAAEVPMSVKIIQASPAEPYLCLVIPLNAHKLSELILKVFPHGVPKQAETQAIYLGQSHPQIIRSAIRLMELILQQENTDLLVPLAIEEIVIRLLRSPAGVSIAQIGIMDSHTQKISKAISWLKENYADAVKIDELAKIAGMSVSSFHTYFKKMTAMSPLQFQKTLRLQEARQLMFAKMMDISHASFEVGYSSSSQFSREYSRYFGVSPAKDLANSRN